MNILILCKVVDNYGDMGFAYRLAVSLAALAPRLQISLAVSDVRAFTSLCDERCAAIRILDWNDAASCARACEENFPDTVLECFQCGRPEWLEKWLFGGWLERHGREVRIINIEYLTAESWAEDFHLLKSATRSPRVRKVNFMPGFTDRTGGLLLDRPFMEGLAHRQDFPAEVSSWLSKEDCDDLRSQSCFSVLVFSYPQDFSSIINALKGHGKTQKVHVFSASGAGQSSFLETYRRMGEPFALTVLPFLPQKAWDALLLHVDFAFVRGEDSFSRMCLSGTPFVWQAYPQEGQFHLVKVLAFLERLRHHLPQEDFALAARCFMQYNDSPALPHCSEAEDALASLPPFDLSGQELWQELIARVADMRHSFAAFSRELIANGDLAAHLVDYMQATVCNPPMPQ